ncbi:MFS-type transporter SLC18B1 [Ixodes scapularis]|uniref:MFS-type transporter SLC18B1 n=1 Tax=Ixodes scapularis TaxID=6945 RepID=UPI001C39155B|nr:MFS-type transporter SLC18B1 [Ixodes scapularis]
MGTLHISEKDVPVKDLPPYNEPTLPNVTNAAPDEKSHAFTLSSERKSFGSSDNVPPEMGASSGGGLTKSRWELLRQDVWLLPLVHTEFWISAAFSLIQPYFPNLAISRGIDAWKYGFVFSAFKMAMLIGSFVAEKLMKTKPPTVCYLIGQAGFFTFTIIFGCMYWVPGGDVFLGSAIASALLGGLTHNMYLVSMFAVVTTRFSEQSGLIIGFLEFLWGAGNMLGSAIGGALIELWAFPLPFFVIGAISMLSFPVIASLGSGVNKGKGKKDTTSITEAPPEDNSVNYKKLFLDPVFLGDMITIMMGWIILGFNEPTLEPNLKEFHLRSSRIGTIYMVQFASYCIGCIIAGIVCHFKKSAFYAFLGIVFAALAYVFLGPAVFIEHRRKLWMVYMSQVLTGLGMSAQFIGGYSHVIKLVLERGYPDNMRTSSFISSSIFTFLVIGAIITPPVAGYVVGTYGYRTGCTAMFTLLTVWVRYHTFLTATNKT